ALVGVVEPLLERRERERERLRPVVVAAERDVLVREPGLFVRVQVVRRLEQRQHVREAVADEPDELFLAAHLAVAAREATGPLGRGETLGDDPAEPTGLEALRPATAQAHAAAPAIAVSSATARAAGR